MKYIIIIILCCLVYSVKGQDDGYVDPMSQKERDRLPKPTLILYVMGNGRLLPSVVGENWIIIGPSKWGYAEVWSSKNWKKLVEAEYRWYKKKKPLRRWIGNYNDHNLPK